MKKEILVDIETTGLNPNEHEITQIAAIYKKNGKISGRFNVTGNNSLERFKGFLDGIIDPFDREDKAFFLAWNAKFDSDWLHVKMAKLPDRNFGNYFYHMPVDIQQFCAYKFNRKNIIPENFKLETIARYLGVRCNNTKFHDAEYDIEITNRILRKLWNLK